MSDSKNEMTLDQRIKQRLQSRYAQWLARNKPDTFCYQDPWRNFLRLLRQNVRSVRRLFDVLLPEWLLLSLGAVAGLFLAVGAIFVLSTLIWLIFRYPPPEVEQLSIEDQAHVGFFRLAAIQFAALLAFIPMGISFRDSSEEHRRFRHVMPSGRRRVQVAMIRALAVAVISLSCAAAVVVPLNLPSYAYGAVATSLTGMILFWSSHWVSRWLAVFRITSEGKTGEGLGVCLGLLLFMGCFFVPLFPESVQYAQHLAWLGPTGWLNQHALEIGQGNLVHAWPLVGVWGAMLAIGFLARGRTKTWKHRRRILERNYPNPMIRKRSKQRRDIPLADIPADFNGRLRGVPVSWQEWFFPAWFQSARTLVGTIAVCCLVTQGVAYFVHVIIAQLGDPDQQLVRTELVLVYASIGIMVGTVEVCSLHSKDRALESPFERQPLSPWRLWTRLQLNGLVRLPATLLFTLPMLIIPMVIKQGDPTLALLTLGLSISAAFALRTLGAAVIVQQAIYRELHELIASGLTLLTIGLACGAMLLIMLSTVPDLQGSYPALWLQLAAHGSAFLLFLTGTRVWYFVPRLAVVKS